jgi:hypothetical protein
MGYQKLVLKIFALLFIVFGSLEAFYWLNPYKKQEIEYSYSASIIEKHTRLKSLPSPKMVFVSGSSFAYGLNSPKIEAAMKKPVVNMAIHYNFGSNFLLKQVENEVKSGDCVIMGFEYIVQSQGNNQEKYRLALFYPEAKKWFDYYAFPECIAEPLNIRISSMRINLVKLLTKDNFHPSINDTISIFFRKSINKYGDIIAHLNNPPLKKLPLSMINELTSLDGILRDMNIFTQKMKKKNVKVFYVFPPHAESSYKKDQALLIKFDQLFHKTATFEILGHATDFVYPDSLFQDSPYHLNARGRDLHTQKIIDLLNNSKYYK